MKSNHKEMTATWLREGRLSKGLTQKELAERSNISVRSIQRIENGDLIPRSYTLKTLAGILELSFDTFMAAARKQNIAISDSDVETLPPNRAQRIVLSFGICLAIILLAFAFIVQAPKFPETTFELLLFYVVVLAGMTAAVFVVWRSRA